MTNETKKTLFYVALVGVLVSLLLSAACAPGRYEGVPVPERGEVPTLLVVNDGTHAVRLHVVYGATVTVEPGQERCVSLTALRQQQVIVLDGRQAYTSLPFIPERAEGWAITLHGGSALLSSDVSSLVPHRRCR